MSVKVEKTDNKNEVKLEITVDSKVFDEGIMKVFNKNSKYFNVPGFRKGKAPFKVVERYYGIEIFYEDTFNDVATKAYEDAIKSEKLEIVSKPEIDVVQMEKGKDLIFTATVNTKPEVKLGNYKGVTVEKTETKITAKDVNAELESMAERNARMVSVKRAAKNGDTVTIDYIGTVDGVAFEGGKAENYDLTLGSNTFIPGFEDQVVGMKNDEVRDIKVKFPDEYFSKDLAGKEANFNVTVHEIKEKELPKIDDEFAKDTSEFDTLKELKDDIKAKKEKENEEKSKRAVEDSCIKAVVDDTKVDIPTGMIELELDNMQEEMDRNLSYQGFSFEKYLQMLGKTVAQFRSESREQAITSIKTRLALEAIGNEAKIKVDDKEIDEKIAELAKAYGRKEEELKKNDDLVKSVESNIKTEKTVQYIVDNAKIKVVAENKEETKKDEKNETPAKNATKKTTKK